jgi:gluconate 2-dehydrogenase gamma chain
VTRDAALRETLTEEDRATLAALLDLLLPADDSGPAASGFGIDAAVAARLESPWGRGDDRYLAEPFEAPAAAGFGWQQPESPIEVVANGLRALRRQLDAEGTAGLDGLPADAADELIGRARRGEFDDGSGEFFRTVRELLADALFHAPPVAGGISASAWLLDASSLGTAAGDD